jgi:hypothetical protein
MKFNEKGEIMPDRIEKLKVPKIFKSSDKGNIVHVIGIFRDEHDELWINTASKDNKLVNMKLTDGLRPWGEHTLSMIDIGIIPWPCKVEFGTWDGREYAEIL